MRAIDLDEVDEENIYKINLLEAMLMAKASWDAVSSETIRNCWVHLGIQG
jgi:DDE superfamily endonuclease